MSSLFAVSTLADLSPLEVHKLYKLRVDVFVHEQRCPYAEIDDIDALDSTKHVQMWKHDGENRTLLGTARVYPTTATIHGTATEAVQIGRVVLTPTARGTGLSDELMINTLRLCEEQFSGLPVYLEAQSPLQDFYGAYGFQVCGPEFEEERIAHLPMVKLPR